MTRKLIVASFADENDLLHAIPEVRNCGWEVSDVYAPYVVHGLESALGWRRSWLPAACLFGGIVGVGLAIWFQFWTTAQNWPVNVGGRPWNSLPAFVPVAFETMVLFAGFALVFAWLIRCGLYPGKDAVMPTSGVTDSRFALVCFDPTKSDSLNNVRAMLSECHALDVQEHEEGA
jgi:hypothetical protein